MFVLDEPENAPAGLVSGRYRIVCQFYLKYSFLVPGIASRNLQFLCP